MDFIEDLEDYNKAMENAYDFITGKVTLDDLVIEMEKGHIHAYNLPFNPEVSDGRDEGTIDMVIEHFSDLEEYEKCEVLMKCKWNVEEV